MATIEKHSPGSFCWIELATTDQRAGKQFYSDLLGWTGTDFPMGPAEVYTVFQLQGLDTGGCLTLRKEQLAQGVPPNWLLYAAVEDADAKAAKAKELGATILMPAFDVMELGRMSVIQDPTGAVFALWQAKQHIGTRIGGVDSTLCWADLSTRDVEKAKSFYSSLFGWSINAGENDSSGYLHISNGKQMIGGIAPAADQNPNVPPHWMIYFQVPDVDATTAKTQSSGGSVLLPPMTMENVGRMAVLADPQGAVFAVFKSARQ